MFEHAPEPWESAIDGQGRGVVLSRQADHDMIHSKLVAVLATDPGMDPDANAGRIVACVNGCAGITAEALASVFPRLRSHLATIQELLEAALANGSPEATQQVQEALGHTNQCLRAWEGA